MLNGYRYLYGLHKNKRHYSNIAKDIEKRSDTLNYELGRPLPKRKK